MTPRDTLALDLTEDLVKITVNGTVTSGAIRTSVAAQRIKALRDRNPGARFDTIPATTPRRRVR